MDTTLYSLNENDSKNDVGDREGGGKRRRRGERGGAAITPREWATEEKIEVKRDLRRR
jgi:hypothetical protein